MSNRNSFYFLSTIALLVVFMAGATWYHNVLYHNNPGSVRAENQPMKMNKDTDSNASENKPNTPSSVDISTIVKDLNLPKDKLDQTMRLVQNLLSEEELASKNINGLIPKTAEDTGVSEQIGVLQRDFKNKFDLFQLDLSDLIGEQSAEKLANGLEAIIPPILLQNNAPAPAMDMNMDM